MYSITYRIEYTLPAARHVSLKIYDIIGEEVATLIDGVVPAGRHKQEFVLRDLSSGIYFYQLH